MKSITVLQFFNKDVYILRFEGKRDMVMVVMVMIMVMLRVMLMFILMLMLMVTMTAMVIGF